MHIAQNFIPMLNNQYKQYRCYYFSRGSPCNVSSHDLVLVISFDADHSHKPPNLLLSINISVLSLFVRSATLICTQVWFMAKPVVSLALTAAVFKVHLCVIKVTARKYLSGSLIKTEGEILITKSNGKTSQHSQPRARPNTSVRNLDLREIPQTLLFHLNLQTPTVGYMHICPLCIIYIRSNRKCHRKIIWMKTRQRI